MAQVSFLQAAVTGLFCIGFAVVVDAVTDALPLLQVMLLSFASGFLGSLLAQTVLRGRGRRLTGRADERK